MWYIEQIPIITKEDNIAGKKRSGPDAALNAESLFTKYKNLWNFWSVAT